MKFHSGPNGPGKCTATQKPCPFGGESGEENHYSTMEEASAAFERSMEDSFGQTAAIERPPFKKGVQIFEYSGSSSPYGYAVSAKVSEVKKKSMTVELDFYSLDGTDSDQVIEDTLSAIRENGYGGGTVYFEITSRGGWETTEAVYDPNDEELDSLDDVPVKFPLEMGNGYVYGKAVYGDDGWENGNSLDW